MLAPLGGLCVIAIGTIGQYKPTDLVLVLLIVAFFAYVGELALVFPILVLTPAMRRPPF